jgi:GNAT superfamily N-acetyltransferase
MAFLAKAEGPLLDQILDATYDIWNDGLDRSAYGRWYAAQLATPWGRAHLERWSLVDADAVIASAKVYRFDAALDGRSIRIVGLGAIFTPPAHRGRGAARELVTRLLDRAAADGVDAALLFSEIGPDYYRRLGFDALPIADLTLRVVEDARRGAPAVLVRSGDDRDLDNIVAMDAVRAAPYRFHLSRDRDVAHYAIAKKRLLAGLARSGARALQFFVAEEGASAVAYVVIAEKHGAWTIDSCGDRDPAGARLGAILQVLIARDPGERRPAIRAWLPSTLRPPQIEIVERAPSRDVAMLRPLTDNGRPSRALAAEEILYWRGDAF